MGLEEWHRRQNTPQQRYHRRYTLRKLCENCCKCTRHALPRVTECDISATDLHSPPPTPSLGRIRRAYPPSLHCKHSRKKLTRQSGKVPTVDKVLTHLWHVISCSFMTLPCCTIRCTKPHPVQKCSWRKRAEANAYEIPLHAVSHTAPNF